MKDIKFVKAVASGNDFIIIDNSQLPACPPLYQQGRRAPSSQPRLSKLAKELCRRKLSVGADGLLVIEPSKKAHFKMRIFNPDGSEVDMCGNGLRCLALYAHRNRIVSGAKMVIETRAGKLEAEVKQDRIRLKMPRPKDLRLRFELDIDGQPQSVNYINTGVPHVVCFAQGLDNFNVEETGKAIRYHPEFQPAGTNANFVEVLDKNHIRIRTYERGVEQETLACGTGAAAAGIVTACQTEKPRRGQYKIKVDTRSGEALAVYFNIEKNEIDKVYLKGKAKIVYRGGLHV